MHKCSRRISFKTNIKEESLTIVMWVVIHVQVLQDSSKGCISPLTFLQLLANSEVVVRVTVAHVKPYSEPAHDRWK